jgi:hypothetical protein
MILWEGRLTFGFHNPLIQEPLIGTGRKIFYKYLRAPATQRDVMSGEAVLLRSTFAKTALRSAQDEKFQLLP